MDTVLCVARNEIDSDSSVMVGSGAYASVYQVRIATTGDNNKSQSQQRVYALKKLHCSCANRQAAAQDLLEEAKLLAELPRHENIVTLHGVSTGFWRLPTTGFLLLEYLPESLESRMASWKGSDAAQERRVMEVCLPIARALSFLHQHDICYRDLKPKNIGFDAQGKVRLYDFGFARHVLALTNDRVGTPRYMAPEVMQKQFHDASCDVYSWAILTWEILTLEKPYNEASNFEQLFQMVVKQNVRPALDKKAASREMKELLWWCWHKEPAQRPSCEQVVKDLTRACRGVANKQAKPSGNSRRSVAPERRKSITSCAA